jgi:hypothetical protein
MKVIFLALTVLAAASLSSLSASAGEEGDGDYGSRIRKLTREIQVLYLLNLLDLSEGQERALLPLAVEARKLHARYAEDAEGCRREMEDAFKALKAEDEADRGLSKEVQKRASGANKKYKDLGEEFRKRMSVLEKRVKAILTAEQWEKARAYQAPVLEDGKFRPPRGRKGGKRKPSREEKLLREIRSAPAAGFTRIEKELVTLQIEREEARRGEAYEAGRRKAREGEIRLLFQQVRQIGNDTFEERLQSLCREIKPRTRTEELQAALRSIALGPPPLGAAGKYLLSPIAADILEKRIEKK